MSDAVTTVGVKLQSGDGATPTEAFATIGEVTDFAGPDETADQIEVTNFDSVAKEFRAALVDSGEVTFSMNFIGSNAKQQALRTDIRAGTVRNFKLIIKDRALEADCTSVAFAAIVRSLSGPKGGVDAKITQDCTLKVTGQPTWDYATAA